METHAPRHTRTHKYREQLFRLNLLMCVPSDFPFSTLSSSPIGICICIFGNFFHIKSAKLVLSDMS